MRPATVNGWSVAHLGGGLLLSASDFTLRLGASEVDKLLGLLNDGRDGVLRDVDGRKVHVSPSQDALVLTRPDDRVYPHGIILPVDAFSELDKGDAPIIEGLRPAFRRVGGRIVRGYRVTSGRRKGQVVADPATAHHPPVPGRTRAKLRAAAVRKRLVRALKAKLTRRRSVSIRLRRLNHTD